MRKGSSKGNLPFQRRRAVEAALAVADATQAHNESPKPEKRASEAPIAHASPQLQNGSRPCYALRWWVLPVPRWTPRRSLRPLRLPTAPTLLPQRWSDRMGPRGTELVATGSPSLSSLAWCASADS